MREKAVRFGTSAPLIGVVTEPAAGRAAPGRPAVIFLNSGILHHVGACRLYVNAARALAAQGFLVMRFDHAGIGDSEPRREAMAFEPGAILDTRDAMDYLTTTRGAKTFVLMGLCSGADMSFRAACADPRVVGLVQLDAWAYRTPGFYLRHYGRRVGKLDVWRNFLRRKLATAKPAPSNGAVPDERPADAVTAEYRRTFPPREKVAADLRTLLGRGIDLLYVFSGGQEEHYNYREQYAQSFRDVPFNGRLRVEYLGDADHLFTGLAHQRFVIDTAVEWMNASYGATPDAVRAPVASPAVRVPAVAATR